MKKILVIEDEEDVRLNLAEILELEGFSVRTTRNGEDGLKTALEWLPDLIISDIMMPVLNGYEILMELQKHPQTMRIPFIFLTAKAASQDIRKGMRLGADDYLIKPFNTDELIETIKIRLRKHEELQRELDTFRHNLSIMLPHELRTPLTIIQGYAALMTDPFFHSDRESTMKMAQSILNASLRLTRLVENYILYSRLSLFENERDKIQKWFAQAPVLPRMITRFINERALEAGRTEDLVFNLCAETVTIPHDTFFKILDELFDNAVKFSKKQDRIEVITTYAANFFSLTLKDDGSGFTQQEIDRLGGFVQFQRHLSEQQGSGLGLIICKQLCHLTGGTLTIESTRQAGTTVSATFILPD